MSKVSKSFKAIYIIKENNFTPRLKSKMCVSTETLVLHSCTVHIICSLSLLSYLEITSLNLHFYGAQNNNICFWFRCVIKKPVVLIFQQGHPVLNRCKGTAVLDQTMVPLGTRQNRVMVPLRTILPCFKHRGQFS